MGQFCLLCILCLLCALCALCLLCALCAHSGVQSYEIIVNCQFSTANYLHIKPFSAYRKVKEATKKQIIASEYTVIQLKSRTFVAET